MSNTRDEKAAAVIAQLTLCLKQASIIRDLAEININRLNLREADEILLDVIGGVSHRWMEHLGDCINACDGALVEDEAEATPIYETARRLFPLGA